MARLTPSPGERAVFSQSLGSGTVLVGMFAAALLLAPHVLGAEGGARSGVATDLSSVEAAYTTGDFARAAALVDGLDPDARDARAQVLAARALTAEAVLCLDRAEAARLAERLEAHARAALALDPSQAEARRYLAAALWLANRDTPAFRAWRSGAPQEARDALEAALAVSPGDAWASALLGGWHLEVVRRGGKTGARLLGASEAQGAELCAQAVADAPDDAAIAVQCAIALLSVDVDRHQDQAADALALAEAAPTEDAFEARMQARGAGIGAMLAAQELSDVRLAVLTWVEG